MRRVATQIFLAFAVALTAFGIAAGSGILRLHDLGTDLRLLSAGYVPLTRLAAQLDVKEWVASRALEARALDPAARRAWLPVARAQFPAVVKERIEEARRVADAALAIARPHDAAFLRDVKDRLDALAAKWARYDAAARALLDAVEAGEDPAALEPRAQEVRQLEKGLSVDVKLLQAALEAEIGDRLAAAEQGERRTVVLVVVYSFLALTIGAGAALVSRRLLAPIAVLTEGVKAVGAGDLSRKVEVRSRDELGELAREFNAMAASLDRQRSELRRAERLAAVGRISAQITHEIRNPLNAIGLNTELLAEELGAVPQPPREALALVAAITREVDRLNAVSEEYLRFTRARAAPARQDLAELLSGLLDFLAPELSAARIEVARDLPPGLPPVRGDESQLRAVFLNLVRNAREAMPDGGRIEVAVRREGDELLASIRDTGGGIPPGVLTRIFEPFYSTKERGTGLGLAFSLQVVQEHGGRLECESAVGRGTVFSVRFPAAADERAERLAPEATSAS